MPITGQNIADKVEIILQDQTNIRWTEAELLGWINSGQHDILVYKPNANPMTTAIQCAAGTKQALPAGGTQFGKVTRNMGANGTTPGDAITGVNMEVLDTMIPGWHSTAAAAASKHFCFDPRFPKVFYVYPPQTGYVELFYFAIPADLSSMSSAIFDDLYETALIDYVLYRAYLKDSEFAGNAQRADYHFKAYVNALGGKTAGEKGLAPGVKFDRQPAQPQG